MNFEKYSKRLYKKGIKSSPSYILQILNKTSSNVWLKLNRLSKLVYSFFPAVERTQKARRQPFLRLSKLSTSTCFSETEEYINVEKGKETKIAPEFHANITWTRFGIIRSPNTQKSFRARLTFQRLGWLFKKWPEETAHSSSGHSAEDNLNVRSFRWQLMRRLAVCNKIKTKFDKHKKAQKLF